MNNTPNSITVYRPNQRHALGFLATWSVMTRNIIASRELIWQLFKRDFLAAYKKSFLGIAWIFIMPVVGIASWVFLQKTGLLKPGDVGIPFPAYVLVGTSMWGLFVGFYDSASRALKNGKELITQVNFPHEALVFKETAQHLAGFLIVIATNIVVLVAFGIVPSWKTMFLPAVALPLFMLGAAIGLVVSMIGVVAVDVGNTVTVLIGLLMYGTPILYGNRVPGALIQTVSRWNPLTYLVCSCRDLVIWGRLYEPREYYLCSFLSFILFALAWRLFYVAEHRLVEKMT